MYFFVCFVLRPAGGLAVGRLEKLCSWEAAGGLPGAAKPARNRTNRGQVGPMDGFGCLGKLGINVFIKYIFQVIYSYLLFLLLLWLFLIKIKML